jgi:hypothetical protein
LGVQINFDDELTLTQTAALNLVLSAGTSGIALNGPILQQLNNLDSLMKFITTGYKRLGAAH